jgi:hypothetical protein
VMLPILREARIPRQSYRAWIADIDNGLAGAVKRLQEGYDACQYDWHYLGLNLDVSLCAHSFIFNPKVHAA